MKSIIKKLGIALALAALCIPVAPVATMEAVAEANLETNPDLVRGYRVRDGILCIDTPCPWPWWVRGPKICCEIIVIPT